MPSAIQELHDLEVQGAIVWPVDGKIIVRLGCPLDDKFHSEALVSNFSEAERWLREAADLPPKKDPANGCSIVDELFAAGILMSALWVYDGMFQATFASPDDTAPPEDWISAESWAELEQEIRATSRRCISGLAKKRAKRPSK
jgi:hypothetical protein